MQYRSESFFKEYLKNITNDQLMQFYDDVEWTPFPVLVLKEYQKRFKTKNKKDVLEKLKIQRQLAKEKTSELKIAAKTKSSKVKQKIKRKSERISQKVQSAKRFAKSEKNLLLLEKLGELHKKGIVSKTEFQTKKKELLERI